MQSTSSLFWHQHPLTRVVAIAAALVAVLAAPAMLNAYYMHILILIAMYVGLAVAWNWLGGYAGQPSIGHSMFFGVGAYGTTLCQIWLGLNPWLGTAAGIAIALVAGVLIGLPTFRLKGHYFAIATIALSEILFAIFANWSAVGGGAGLSLPIGETSLWNFRFTGKTGYWYVIATVLIAAILVTYWIERSKAGYYFRAIKGDADAAKAVGIDILQYKMRAMLMSAGLSALIGAFWANYVLFVDPESTLTTTISIQILLIAALGGVGTVWGPLIGAIILIPLSESTRAWLGGSGAGAALMLYGGLIMLVAVIQPAGIMGAVRARQRARAVHSRA